MLGKDGCFMKTPDHVCFGCMSERTEDRICSICGWEHSSEPLSHMHLKPGTVLQGKYLIGKALGQGGFGVTYLALDMNLDVKLAIKEYLPQDLASRSQGHTHISVHSGSLNSHYYDGLERFLQEAKTLARFEGHPNIVSVRDFFKANGTAYFVMSYIEGITLKDFIREKDGRIPVDQAINIMMPVLEALKEVHRYNILHRDISPDNIFMTAKGRVILIDFGAARQAVKDKGRSMSIIMKPGFTPEEQYRSKGQQGPWTDIYALGATIYRAITGQMPPESLDRLVEDDLIPPASLGVSIDLQMERALLKSMAVMAKDRFQSAEDFQHALVEGMIDEPKEVEAMEALAQEVPEPPVSVPPPPPSPPYQPIKPQNVNYADNTPKKKTNSKVLMGIGGVVAGLLVIMLVIFGMGGSDQPINSENGQEMAQESESTNVERNDAEVEGQNSGLEAPEEEPEELVTAYDLGQAIRQSGYADLFGVSEQTLFNMYGQPSDSFYWEGGLFYEYQDFYAMVDEFTHDRMVTVIGLRDLPGLPVNASFDEVKRVYGEPEWDEFGTSNNSHLLHYDVNQQYAVVFEGFSDRKVDFITIHSLYLDYDYDDYDPGFEDDFNDFDQELAELYDLGYQMWQTWVYVNYGTTVWAEPNYYSYTLGEITREGDFYVTDYDVDLDYNLWLQLELIDENNNYVYGWVAF